MVPVLGTVPLIVPQPFDILAAIALIYGAGILTGFNPRPPRHRLRAGRKAILKMDRAPYLSKPRWLARLWARTKSA
jgi:hypothetical protein